MDGSRSPVHDIVNSLWRSLRELGANVSPTQVEQWGFAIHAALSAAGREYHNHDHVIDLVSAAGPTESLAALYHDAVYWQVDHGPPRSMQRELADLFDAPTSDAGSWRILPTVAARMPEVLAVFGKAVGDVVTPTTGLNELASALVAWAHLSPVLARQDSIAIVAAIEQTVPFRANAAALLHARLTAAFGTEFTATKLNDIVQQAVRVGNLDVANFAADSAAEFLENTWKLLPETNPSLHQPMVYSVIDYRTALWRMEAFLASLDPARVFHAWNGEPTPAQHERLLVRTQSNLDIAVTYLRAKLFAVAIIEAIAELTGGDVPLDYFMGGIKSLLRPQVRRLETFLPTYVRPSQVCAVGSLLIDGRLTDSSFDIAPSPVASYLYASLGLAGTQDGFAAAKRYWANAFSAQDFLQQHRHVAGPIALAAAHLLDTRQAALTQLAATLGG